MVLGAVRRMWHISNYAFKCSYYYYEGHTLLIDWFNHTSSEVHASWSLRSVGVGFMTDTAADIVQHYTIAGATCGR